MQFRQKTRLACLIATACSLLVASSAQAQLQAPAASAPPSPPSSVIVLPPGQRVVMQSAPPPTLGASAVVLDAPPILAPPTTPSGPQVLTDWEESRPIPQGYHEAKKTRTDLIIAGATLFGAMYLLSAFSAAVGQDSASPGANPIAGLWVPGVGPFIAMPHTGTATGNFFLAIDGIVQVGGLSMFTIGLASPKTVLRRDDSFGANLRIAPVVAPDHQGLSLVGSF